MLSVWLLCLASSLFTSLVTSTFFLYFYEKRRQLSTSTSTMNGDAGYMIPGVRKTSRSDANTVHLGNVVHINDALLNQVMGAANVSVTSSSRGTIALVGAGPGSPKLLTLEALYHIQKADVVIADRLISPSLLSIVGPHTKLLIANKEKGRQAAAQEELNSWALDALSEGLNVVRLKIGDPYIFGRGGEEVQYYRSLGYEPIVVSGISSSFAAPLHAGVPLTLRGVADQIIVATGMGKDFSTPDIPEYRAKSTLVVLMAVERLKHFHLDFAKANYPLTLPVAIIENATTEKERVIHGTIQSISSIANASHVTSPAVIVVGHVVGVVYG